MRPDFQKLNALISNVIETTSALVTDMRESSRELKENLDSFELLIKEMGSEEVNMENGIAKVELQSESGQATGAESSYLVDSEECSEKVSPLCSKSEPINIPQTNFQENGDFIQRAIIEEIASLKQSGTVKEYDRKFQELARKIEGFPESELVICFIRGLKEEINPAVQPFLPSTMSQARGLAELREKSLEEVARRSKISGVSLSSCSRNTTDSTQLALLLPTELNTVEKENIEGTPTVRSFASECKPTVGINRQEEDDNFKIDEDKKQDLGTKNDTRFAFDSRRMHGDGSDSICNKWNLKLGENFKSEGMDNNSKLGLDTHFLLDENNCLKNVWKSKTQYSTETKEKTFTNKSENFLSSVNSRSRSCVFSPCYLLIQASKCILPMFERVGLTAAMETQTMLVGTVQTITEGQTQRVTNGDCLYKLWDPGGIDSNFSLGFMPPIGHCRPVANGMMTKTMKTTFDGYTPYASNSLLNFRFNFLFVDSVHIPFLMSHTGFRIVQVFSLRSIASYYTVVTWTVTAQDQYHSNTRLGKIPISVHGWFLPLRVVI
ncbi:hypothetical protein Vadar_029880 [Vaccinium darrowii]|uniref:Uncharacterized protein n=1 Tax=Vaccinium darrowii TaxID=229202 RepID=A0ACB7XKZ4_9ERIC|nr:hypothetical protein Vadar_029880 [Vaccinium darrowii]